MNFPNLCFSLPKRWRSLRNLVLASLAAASIPAASAQSVSDGPLKMEIITAYNFVVDSNVESPSTKGQAAANPPAAPYTPQKLLNTLSLWLVWFCRS